MNRKYNNIDDLFRDKFDDFEVDPPDYVWENVKSHIGNTNGNGRGSGLNKGGIAGITILLIATGLISLFFITNSPVVSNETSGDQKIIPEENRVLLADNASVPQQELTGVPEQSVDDGEKKSGKQEKPVRIRGGNAKKNSTVIIAPVIEPVVEAGRNARMPLTVNSLKAGELENNVVSEKPATIEFTHSSNTAANPLDGSNPPQEADMLRGQDDAGSEAPASTGIRSDYGADGRWLFGVYFTPEIITYPSDDQLKNYSYSLDLNFTYKTGSYFLQSGFGFARNHDQGNSMIDYNKYLGSYEDVYDVTFDSAASGIVPVYHTETVHVYDSISHVTINPTKRYFTYLQVPLFVGYGSESRRFGWFVKGGPSLSFLINEKIPSSGMEETEARVLNIENELPGRISTHWQFIVSAGVTCKLGSRISISMEPMFRYYINSVYEQDKLNTKHPFSAGLRTGLLLSF